MNFYDWLNFDGLHQKGALWKIVGSILLIACLLVGLHLFFIHLVQG